MSQAFGITARQAQTLKFIRGYHAEHGFSPSYAEIAEAIGVASKSRVHWLVHALAERGHIRLIPGSSRSIAPVERGAA